jgi:hypothetical protein
VKSLTDWVAPVLFLVVGAFWVAIVATGGAILLVFAALAFIISGLLLLAVPLSWVTRPMAGATTLFGLVLTIYQVYQATTLFGTGLSSVGVTSGAVFGVFAIVCVYLELATLSIGAEQVVAKKP